MMKIFDYEIESIQIGKVFKIVVFNIYQKNIEIKSKNLSV